MPGACCRSCGWLSLLLSLRRSPAKKKTSNKAQKHTKVQLCNTLQIKFIQIHHNLQHPSVAAFHPQHIRPSKATYIYIFHPWHPSIRPCKCPSIYCIHSSICQPSLIHPKRVQEFHEQRIKTAYTSKEPLTGTLVRALSMNLTNANPLEDPSGSLLMSTLSTCSVKLHNIPKSIQKH